MAATSGLASAILDFRLTSTPHGVRNSFIELLGQNMWGEYSFWNLDGAEITVITTFGFAATNLNVLLMSMSIMIFEHTLDFYL